MIHNLLNDLFSSISTATGIESLRGETDPVEEPSSSPSSFENRGSTRKGLPIYPGPLMMLGLIGQAHRLLAPFSPNYRKIDNGLAEHPLKLPHSPELVRFLFESQQTFGPVETVLNFIEEYRGPAEFFEKAVRERHSFLDRARGKDIDPSELVDWLPQEGPYRTLWRHFCSQGGFVSFASSDNMDVAGAVKVNFKTFEFDKEMKLAYSWRVGDIHNTFAHEVWHIGQSERLRSVGPKALAALKSILAERLAPDPIDMEESLRSAGHAHAGAEAAIWKSAKAHQISDDVARRALVFLMEMDAYRAGLEIYEEDIREHPERKVRMFDTMLLYPDRANLFLADLIKKYFGILDPLVHALQGITFEDLLASVKAPSLHDVVQENFQATRTIPWKTKKEVIAFIPPLIRRILARGPKPSYMGLDYMDEELLQAGEADPALIKQLVDFIADPVVIGLMGDEGYQRVLEIPGDGGRDFYEYASFSNHISHALRLLGKWNERHHTTLGIPQIYDQIRRGLGDSRYFFSALFLDYLMKTTDSQKVSNVVDSFKRSPVLYHLKRDLNGSSPFFTFLEDCLKDPNIVLPHLKTLRDILLEWFDFCLETAKRTRGIHDNFYAYGMNARYVADGARKYFEHVGEKFMESDAPIAQEARAYAQFFERRLQEAEALFKPRK